MHFKHAAVHACQVINVFIVFVVLLRLYLFQLLCDTLHYWKLWFILSCVHIAVNIVAISIGIVIVIGIGIVIVIIIVIGISIIIHSVCVYI